MYIYIFIFGYNGAAIVYSTFYNSSECEKLTGAV